MWGTGRNKRFHAWRKTTLTKRCGLKTSKSLWVTFVRPQRCKTACWATNEHRFSRMSFCLWNLHSKCVRSVWMFLFSWSSWWEVTSASRRFTAADTAAGSWPGSITSPKESWSPTASRTGTAAFGVTPARVQGPVLLRDTAVHRYTLQASTFQMAILLQYNTEDSYTVQQLTDSTQIKTVRVFLKTRLHAHTHSAQLQLQLVLSVFRTSWFRFCRYF